MERGEPFSYERLGKETEEHLDHLVLQGDGTALDFIKKIGLIRESLARVRQLDHDQRVANQLRELGPCFACLPKGDLAAERAMMYAKRNNGEGLTPHLLSTAIRHHLYDAVLYATDDDYDRNSNRRFLTPSEGQVRISKV